MKEGFINTYKILDEANDIMNDGRRAKYDGTLDQAKKRIFENFTNECDFNFSTKEIDFDDWEIIQNFNSKNSLKSKNSDWISINQLEYKFQQKLFDFSEILPEGYNLLVYPNSEKNIGTLYPEAKKIVITGNLASIGTLLILLHEIGHIRDFDKLEKLGTNQLTEGGLDFENSSAEELRKEREASLFALRKIWPIFKDDPQMKSDVIMYAKNLAYASYGEQANDIRNVKFDDGGWEDWENE